MHGVAKFSHIWYHNVKQFITALLWLELLLLLLFIILKINEKRFFFINYSFLEEHAELVSFHNLELFLDNFPPTRVIF